MSDARRGERGERGEYDLRRAVDANSPSSSSSITLARPATSSSTRPAK